MVTEAQKKFKPTIEQLREHRHRRQKVGEARKAVLKAAKELAKAEDECYGI